MSVSTTSFVYVRDLFRTEFKQNSRRLDKNEFSKLPIIWQKFHISEIGESGFKIIPKAPKGYLYFHYKTLQCTINCALCSKLFKIMLKQYKKLFQGVNKKKIY